MIIANSKNEIIRSSNNEIIRVNVNENIKLNAIINEDSSPTNVNEYREFKTRKLLFSASCVMFHVKYNMI